MKQQVTLTRQAIRTPRAAAEAGITFSVLFTTSMILIRLALPEELRRTDIAAWLMGNTTTISLALTLVPFPGIAFLWLVWVVRSRLGTMDDQFFSTVFILFISLRSGRAEAEGVVGTHKTSTTA
jgi:ABC-type Fe3+-siderophore transport system permease subunit